MTGQNIKIKYLMCQIPIKMLKQHAIPNSSLQNLKIYSSKRWRKTSQRWIMHVANSIILEFWISHFRLLVFALTGEYFYCWHWRVLPKVILPKLYLLDPFHLQGTKKRPKLNQLIYSQDHPDVNKKNISWYGSQYLPQTLTFILIATNKK